MGLMSTVKSALKDDSSSTHRTSTGGHSTTSPRESLTSGNTATTSPTSNTASTGTQNASSGSNFASTGTTAGSANRSSGTTGSTGSTTSPAKNLAREAESGATSHQVGDVPMDKEGRVTKDAGAGHAHREAEKLIDASQADHSHQMLAHKTHENVKHHEVEEVTRLREHDRHIHHVQHTTQRIRDEQVNETQHHERAVPVTQIKEGHATADADKLAFREQVGAHTDMITHAPKERQVVDKGEVLTENVHHHVHNVIQPIVERTTHDHHRIHTTIPVHHTTHEAPIVHQSQELEPISMAQFTSQGHSLGKGVTADQAGSSVLDATQCERTVDGVAEKLHKQLLSESGTSGTMSTS
ncbi:uncharacterized protein L969DRAFT_101795 [Mixia osmundae IAM 14324]|uniref:Allergen n=1 Tax=Mixia osmundae (strain CBS 9802 / IAM 14324 / JCM 22182 / KY 12970) TaxID=764103 RepID=G7DYP1_MIXOS|nr:uncharacterized protein L969DRAFT_101795 [Mixia osmundae IAM 14324]KEI41600.1 hypothetical protein L969DRAFT_101795 [Mixia osmundae IAM 14324]GAA95701.1 hypothetical protein E5Q_02358 [Mixia osmundae IAM 14324]